ncbi:hypothetical protein GCM10010532_043560 [Dactylosporangium siamense]|uniref:Uncharacterized protein n=1 Tax=Dactylosporangium siamense TaxID=685454 RepID=A0A919PMK4_9ACTN|nr:hypothetical protein Dsi01nite_032110 [Dactylosporangium siamense]
MGRPAGWMQALTGRSAMRSPGAPALRRDKGMRKGGVVRLRVEPGAAHFGAVAILPARLDWLANWS